MNAVIRKGDGVFLSVDMQDGELLQCNCSAIDARADRDLHCAANADV
jgi:hypothetical protein